MKIVAGLKEQGFDIDVLTINPLSFDAPGVNLVDPTLNQCLPEGILNYQVWSWEVNFFFQLIKKIHSHFPAFTKLVEPRKKEWIYPAIRFLKKQNLHKYDVILTCSQPHANHLIGSYIKETTGKPWIAYFSDPWTDNPYASFKSQRIYNYHRKLEEKIINQADIVLFTSPEMQDLVVRKYPEYIAKKCDVLPHSYVPQWYELAKTKKSTSSKILFLHTGHFYGPRSPMPLFNALEKLNRKALLSERIEIVFYGNMEEKYRQFVYEKGLQSFISIEAPISYLESLKKMKEADFLLLIDAPTVDDAQSVFLPSKLVDYLGSFRPVIGITPLKGASARVLSETGNYLCDIDSENEIIKLFENLLSTQVKNTCIKENIERYHYRTVTERLAHIINGLYAQ
ncbi:glycosyltransferase [Thermodesulfobacteriota bacterium]